MDLQLAMPETPKISIWNLGIIGRSNVDALKNAIDDGADVHELSENNYSLLHCAAENGAMDNVTFLLDLGVNPKLKSLGKTAADLARAQGENDIAELLDAWEPQSGG